MSAERAADQSKQVGDGATAHPTATPEAENGKQPHTATLT